MKKMKMVKTLIAVIAGSVLLYGSSWAETVMDKAKAAADDTGEKIDSSMKKMGNFMDDSAITAKVKAALVDNDAIKSSDISVETEKGVVMLTGFVTSQEQAQKAIAVSQGVEGVKSVSNKLHVRSADNKEMTLKGYAGDAATTSEIKTKLFSDDAVPSRNIKVETTDGVVQLSGTVENKAQSARAENIAKAVDGVKSVKNDLSIKP